MSEKNQHRRAIDNLTEEEAEELLISKRTIELIHADLQEIKKQLETVKEILEAWNNAKGFVRIVRIIGEVAKWLVIAGGAIAAIWYWIRRG